MAKHPPSGCPRYEPGPMLACRKLRTIRLAGALGVPLREGSLSAADRASALDSCRDVSKGRPEVESSPAVRCGRVAYAATIRPPGSPSELGQAPGSAQVVLAAPNRAGSGPVRARWLR